MKNKTKMISKFITFLVTESIISSAVAVVISKHIKNVPLCIILTIAGAIATSTLVDVVMYLVEMAYEHGDLSLCEAAGAIEELMKVKGKKCK